MMRAILAVLLAATVFASATAGPLEDAIDAAEEGDATAQRDLGLRYAEGRGAPQDFAEAARWLAKAADAGEAAAQSKLGWMYENGFGVSSDAAAAALWYRSAAEKGDAAAQSSLGRMTLYGDGVPRDLAAAETWLRKAERGGDAVAARMAVVNLEELARLRRTMPAEEAELRPAAARDGGAAVAGASAKPERAGGGGLTVRIVETPVVSQPAPFSAGTTVVVPRTRIEIYEGARRLVILDGEKLEPDLIESLNALGLGPEALAAVLGALGVAGASHGVVEAK